MDVERVDVWSATIEDKPGALAAVLNALRQAGANLQFIIARRAPEKSGTGVVFVAPLRNDKEIRAAEQAGFNTSQSLQSVRLTGADRAGMAAELTEKLAAGGINLRGFSASVIGSQFVAYVALDSSEQADKAKEILQKA